MTTAESSPGGILFLPLSSYVSITSVDSSLTVSISSSSTHPRHKKKKLSDDAHVSLCGNKFRPALQVNMIHYYRSTNPKRTKQSKLIAERRCPVMKSSCSFSSNSSLLRSENIEYEVWLLPYLCLPAQFGELSSNQCGTKNSIAFLQDL
jgi:hypothetical protein